MAESPEESTSILPDTSSSTNNYEIYLTHARNTISPYLPPPALSLIQKIDTNDKIKSYIPNNEPSMTILATILSLSFFAKVMKLLFFRKSKSVAVDGLDDEDPNAHVLGTTGDGVGNGSELEAFTDSVVLFGPCGSGKSVLFHQLTKGSDEGDDNDSDSGIRTVMSLRANIKVKDEIRIVDYPGHITLSSQLPSLLLPNTSRSGAVRAVLVVDATKSLSEAGALFYQTVLSNLELVHAWKKESQSQSQSDKNVGMKIMVVCNKSDETSAKNWRRVKIQLRTELDKLKKISQTLNEGSSGLGGNDGYGDAANAKFELEGKGVNLDDLSKNGVEGVSVNFMSVSAMNGDGMDELKAFVGRGEVLADNSSILKSGTGRRK